MLCDDLEGWEGRLKREGIYIYIYIYIYTYIHIHIQLVRVVIQQKLMQHCKAIILQLKR